MCAHKNYNEEDFFFFYPPDFELYGCGLVNESSRLRLVSIHPCDCSLPELYMV